MALVAVLSARGRVCIATDDTALAITTLENAVAIAAENEFADMELVAHGLLAEIFKGLGRFEEALFHREESTRIHEQIFDRDTDLRIKTLQISHDTLAARDQAELLRVRTTELEELVTARTQDLEEHHYEAFERLAAIAEYRDPDSGEHSSRVGELAAELAIAAWARTAAGPRSSGWRAGCTTSARWVYLTRSCRSRVRLTDDEFEVMKTHTTIGATVFAGSRSTLIQLAAEVALSHHERWDGSGYPFGLRGEAIPLSGRIVAVADVYDALITAHRYKHAWSSSDAVSHMVAGRGTQFEPRIVDALVARRRGARRAATASSIPPTEG